MAQPWRPRQLPPGRPPGSVVGGRLYDLAAASANDVWAVGLNDSGSLIMHWNGSRWTSTSTGLGFLYDVATTGASNAWAVGGTDWFSPATLIYHWNGSTWTSQANPNPPSGGFFEGVAAASASDAWAVGWTGNGTTSSALTEHWNGSAWTVIPVPASAGAKVALGAVAAIPADDVWATGLTAGPGPTRNVILHWNGTSWKRSALPAGSVTGILHGVAASSVGNVWAVGQTYDSAGNCGPACQTITLHYNGCMWKHVPSPNPGGGYVNVLWGAAIIGRDNVWAVGSTDYSTTLILHWNGTSWS